MVAKRSAKQSDLGFERLTELPPEVLAGQKRPFEEHVKDFYYLAQHSEEFMVLYPDEWVAIFETQLVAHAKRHTDLWRQLRKLNLHERAPVTHFLTTENLTL